MQDEVKGQAHTDRKVLSGPRPDLFDQFLHDLVEAQALLSEQCISLFDQLGVAAGLPEAGEEATEILGQERAGKSGRGWQRVGKGRRAEKKWDRVFVKWNVQ